MLSDALCFTKEPHQEVLGTLPDPGAFADVTQQVDLRSLLRGTRGEKELMKSVEMQISSNLVCVSNVAF